MFAIASMLSTSLSMITITGIRDHHRLEPLITIPGMRRRVVKKLSVVKTRNVKPFWEKSVRCLMTGQTATGVEGA